MSKIKETNPNLIFAALKLIEQLYRDGKITATVFRNILNEYSDVVNTSQFLLVPKTPNKQSA